MASVFIIDLPRCNMRVRPIPRAQNVRDPAAFFQIRAMAEAIMPARSEFSRPPRFVMGQHIRVFIEHPARRRGRRCPQNHFQSRLSQHIYGPVEPFELQPARCGFKPAPRKLANSDPRKPRFDHTSRIVFPIFFWPMFGIITNAKRWIHKITLCSA